MDGELKILTGLYEVKREQIILGYLNPATQDKIPASYVYAYESRMCPIFEIKEEDDAFGDVYKTKRELVDKVTTYLDEKWRKDMEGGGEVPSFYDLGSELINL